MYAPPYYRESDKSTLFQWIHQYPFGVLISHLDGEISATHLPFYLDEKNGLLVSHMAHQNPHWQALSSSPEALVIFSGPHCYISPTWYAKKEMVPTWNYQAVHVRGKATLLTDTAAKQRCLRQLVDYMESGMDSPWSIRQLSPRALASNLTQITAFQIAIRDIQGKNKLNQNHSGQLRARVVDALHQSGDAGAKDIADLMTDALKKDP